MGEDRGKTAADGAVTLAMELPARLRDGASTIVMDDPAGDSPPADSPAGTAGQTPATTPRYAVVGHAGAGGMATVHVARDLELLRTVALKQLAEQIAHSDSARQRFLREVQITAQLDHPQIVPIYGLEVAPDGAPAYAMKFVDGRTLDDLIEDAREAVREQRVDEATSLPTRLEHFLKVCDAVHYAHDKGVIHRDLKPANVMIGPHNEIYVMDWGICRLFDREDPDQVDDDDAQPATVNDGSGGLATEYGRVIGTPAYMSPEQAQGLAEKMGPASDQCALGLILQELVTLVPAIEGSSAYDLLMNAARARRRSLSEFRTGHAVPKPLRAIIEHATAAEPERRYPSVRALADDLRRWLRGEAVQAMPDTPWQKALRYVGRHRQQVVFAVVGLVAVAALAFAWLVQRHEQELLVRQQREAQLRALVDDTAALGDELQLRAMRLQGELDALASAATQLLRHGTESGERLYWTADYQDAATRPQDFATRPGFAQPVSLAFGVWSHPDSVPRDAVLAQARRLHHLGDYRNELFELARGTLGDASGASGVSDLLIALESGLCLHYPGVATLADVHDSRSTPWYRRAIEQRGALWGTPVVDPVSGAVMLPLSESLRGPGGEPLGIASLQLSMAYIVHNLLGEANRGDGVTLLLDAQGRILASEEVLSRSTTDDDSTAQVELALQDFPEPELLRRIADSDLGSLETDAFGSRETLVYDVIQPAGWVLVTRVANSQLYR